MPQNMVVPFWCPFSGQENVTKRCPKRERVAVDRYSRRPASRCLRKPALCTSVFAPDAPARNVFSGPYPSQSPPGPHGSLRQACRSEKFRRSGHDGRVEHGMSQTSILPSWPPTGSVNLLATFPVVASTLANAFRRTTPPPACFVLPSSPMQDLRRCVITTPVVIRRLLREPSLVLSER